MKPLKVKVGSIEGNKATIEIYSKVPDKKREIENKTLYVWRGDKTGEIETWFNLKTEKLFQCLHCGAIENHNVPTGHKYPLCSMCRNTQRIFETYFQLDLAGNEYELKPEYNEKVDKEFL